MKTNALNYGALELARTLALCYDLSYSYKLLDGFISHYPEFTLRDFELLRVHVTSVLCCVMDDLHDSALDYATKVMSGEKFFRIQSRLLNQIDELKQLL